METVKKRSRPTSTSNQSPYPTRLSHRSKCQITCRPTQFTLMSLILASFMQRLDSTKRIWKVRNIISQCHNNSYYWKKGTQFTFLMQNLNIIITDCFYPKLMPNQSVSLGVQLFVSYREFNSRLMSCFDSLIHISLQFTIVSLTP